MAETEKQPCSPDEALQIRKSIQQKDWFGFDLDDTLHEFRRASSKATFATLNQISKKHGVPMAQLQDEYSAVLRKKTSGAFTDGRSSFEYRRERFTAMMEGLNISIGSGDLENCLNTYESVITQSLELKPGAIELLEYLKSLGKGIVVISEGPQDAQERALKALAIDKYVDVLVTSNYFGVSKTEGLFRKVLEHLKIASSDMVYIGDNEERDVTPAIAEGIASIHLDEKRDESLNNWPLRVSTLSSIQSLLVWGTSPRVRN